MGSRPDKEIDRKGWNKSWETEVSKIFNPNRTPLALLDTLSAGEISLLRANGSQTSMNVIAKTKEICALQQDLVQLAVRSFGYDDLEAKWKAFTQAKREELVLEGLYVASCAGPDMEDRRRWCPEMTVQNLAGHGKNGFINLLKVHLPDDEITDDITKPIFLPNSSFDAMMRVSSGDELVLRLADDYRLARCYFISMTLWSTLNAFVGSLPN
jgi:hypothetical protein